MFGIGQVGVIAPITLEALILTTVRGVIAPIAVVLVLGTVRIVGVLLVPLTGDIIGGMILHLQVTLLLDLGPIAGGATIAGV